MTCHFFIRQANKLEQLRGLIFHFIYMESYCWAQSVDHSRNAQFAVSKKCNIDELAVTALLFSSDSFHFMC